MNLPDLSLLRLDFRLRAEAPVTLPPYLGSTLRGAFGIALKRVFCFVRHEKTEDCGHEKNEECLDEKFETCWFAEACPFQFIFNSRNLDSIPKEKLHKFLRGQEYFPNPFILIAPDPKPLRKSQTNNDSIRNKDFNDDFRPNHFAVGDHLEFSILLIGKAVRHWAHVLVAVRLLAEVGLGEEHKRAPFSLTAAFAHDANRRKLEVFSRENKKISVRDVSPVTLKQMVEVETFALKTRLEEQNSSRLRIRFLSPASQRILLEGRQAGLGFRSLIKKITERIEFMANLYAEPSQNVNYHSILFGAEEIEMARKSLQFYAYEQRSRQSISIKRHVFLGEIIYCGKRLSEFLPLLAAGEILNVGKDSAHGFGRFIIQI